MLVSPIYRGEARYGTRMRQAGREVISSTIPRLVSDELWEAAQATLARNRICPRNTARTYLLRSVMHCALCGLTYVGSHGSGEAVWYRRGGQLVGRGPHEGRCRSRGIRGDLIEPVVWGDIERFLRDPGELLAELDADTHLAGGPVSPCSSRRIGCCVLRVRPDPAVPHPAESVR